MGAVTRATCGLGSRLERFGGVPNPRSPVSSPATPRVRPLRGCSRDTAFRRGTWARSASSCHLTATRRSLACRSSGQGGQQPRQADRAARTEPIAAWYGTARVCTVQVSFETVVSLALSLLSQQVLHCLRQQQRLSPITATTYRSLLLTLSCPKTVAVSEATGWFTGHTTSVAHSALTVALLQQTHVLMKRSPRSGLPRLLCASRERDAAAPPHNGA